MNKQEIAATIDHTLLKAAATPEQIRALCHEAAAYRFASVCVNPCHVALAAELLSGTGVKVCTVIGFPLGANTSKTKAFETRDAIQNGAEEIDMVINIGAMKAGDIDAVEADIRTVVDAAAGTLIKVILETCYLTDEEIIAACQAAMRAGANFVKTSTGFGTAGATCEHVALMRSHIPASMRVKASGGVRDYDDALHMLEAGASRIGTSAGVTIAKRTADSR